jgi:chromosome partitioning protein
MAKPKVLALYAIKGGVGKTSAAVNLAYLAAESGVRTLLWDLDPQGSATFLLRIKPKVKGGAERIVRGKRPLLDAVKGTDFEWLDLLPADFSYRELDLELDGVKRPTRRLRQLVDSLSGTYDLVVLDCPPSVSLTSESVVEAADLLAVPIVPATLAARSYEQLVTFLGTLRSGAHDGRKVKSPELLAFLSMVDRRKSLHRELASSLPEQFDTFVTTIVPALAAVERMGSERLPVVVSAPSSAATQAYRQLWGAIAVRLDLAPA